MATDPPAGPLSGIRVLDLTNVLAGPYCCYQLALMGAEVIKVERPGSGDLARQLGADPARNAADMGISFLAQNAGKRSITLDLKSSRGTALFKRLVRGADVLVENFRPGVMARLGLDFATLRDENADLIYAAISGFGQDGPWAGSPAYDQIVQGVAGVMAITGTPETAPVRVGYPLADTTGGMVAAFAVAAALNAKPRGAFLDISMTEAVLASMGWVVSNHLIGGVAPAPLGNENATSAPSGTFATSDRPLNIAANRDSQWQALARHLGLETLLDDPRFATREDRKANRAALRVAIETVLITRPAADWARELTALGVPAGPVLSVPEVLASEQIAARDFVRPATLPSGEALQLPGAPVVIGGARPHAPTPPPALGQDNAEIWGALGIDAAELDALRAEGVI